MDERQLVDRAKAGDRVAMGRLYEAHARRVYAVVRRLAGDDHLAEDLSQEAWIRAFERLRLFRGDAAFGTWMYRLATNVALNRLRRLGRRPEREERAELRPAAIPADDGALTRQTLDRALDRLSPGYRQVLVLHDVEGWTHQEIADELGVAEGTSKSQLHKARARMRELLAAPTKREEEAGADVRDV